MYAFRFSKYFIYRIYLFTLRIHLLKIHPLRFTQDFLEIRLSEYSRALYERSRKPGIPSAESLNSLKINYRCTLAWKVIKFGRRS